MVKLEIGKNLSDLIKTYLKYMIPVILIVMVVFGFIMWKATTEPPTSVEELEKRAGTESFKEHKEEVETSQREMDFRSVCLTSEWKLNGCNGDPPELVMAAAKKYLNTADVLEIKMACWCPA